MFDTNVSYAVLGLARSGIAAAYKIRELGGTAFLSDASPVEKIADAARLQQDFDCEFGGHSQKLFQHQIWVVSPGIPLDIPLLKAARERGIELISEIELGFRVKAEDSRIIAVTGSNGKSTTVSLIHHILSKLGYRSILAGNIGSAFCASPIEKPGLDFIVLEISSFQLDLIQSFKPDVAALLNVTPDHLNRYPSFEAYTASKFRIFENQTSDDSAVIYLDSPPIVENLDKVQASLLRYSLIKKAPDCEAWLDGSNIRVGEHLLPTEELLIRGPHNHANVMAALLAVSPLVPSLEPALEAAKSFQSLSHRLEFVAKVRGVSFYNDSKATNTDSVKSALNSFDRPLRVIMGGSDKGEDYSLLTPLLKERAQKLYLTGDSSAKMREVWENRIELEVIDGFADAVKAAFRDSQAGDIVVLSPACASFDRFKNYEERGDFFRRIVQEIRKNHEKE